MGHALIIDDNVILSRAITNRLEAFGFDSFDYTWAEQQALEAAASRAPDLIVVGDTIADGSPLGVAGQLASSGDVPVLVVTAQSFTLQQRTANYELIDGPHHFGELDHVLAAFQAR